MSDPRPAFLCVTVKAGLEKRRYLLFASVSAAKGLVSATFFTERERPTGTVMHKKAHHPQQGLKSDRYFYAGFFTGKMFYNRAGMVL